MIRCGNILEFIRVRRLLLRQESIWLILKVTEQSLGTIRSILGHKKKEQLSEAIASFSGVSLQTSNMLCSSSLSCERECGFPSGLQGHLATYRATFEFIVKSSRRFADAPRAHPDTHRHSTRRCNVSVSQTSVRSETFLVPSLGRYLTFGAVGRLTS